MNKRTEMKKFIALWTLCFTTRKTIGSPDTYKDEERNLGFFPLIDAECRDLEPQEDFDVEAYVREPWFVQKQRIINYLPEDQFHCTEARYNLDPPLIPSIFGWDVYVNNYDENIDGEDRDIFLCATITDRKFPSKLAVSPCFLAPAFFWGLFGPYWVMAFDDDAGWAVIAGGRPSIWTGNGCKNRKDEGLWIFTREQTGMGAMNATLLALDAARAKGIEVDNLDDFKDVNQTSCNREN